MLVLHDQPNDESIGQERQVAVETDPIDHLERPLSNLGNVAAGLRWAEEGERRAIGTWMAKGVVEVVEGGIERRQPAGFPDQPELFIVAHVGQVPDERGHER
jgi:hypothetical protein